MKKSATGRETSVTVAYKRILNKIIKGELLPGSPLREVHIAREFDLSPTPVREAMRCLEHDGWLQSIPFRGRVVRRFTKEDVVGCFLLREGIECVAVRLFIENAPQEIWDELHREVAAEEAFPADCTEEERGLFREMDLHFHELLFSGSGVSALTELYARIRAQLQLLYRGKALVTVAEVVREHRMILEALEDRLTPVAEGLVRHHIQVALMRTLSRESLIRPPRRRRNTSKK